MPSSSCFWCVWRALRTQRTFERMSGAKQKRGGQSAFRVFVLGAVLFVRDPYLSWPLLPGDRQWGLSGVVPGSPSSYIKRVGRRMGALGKEGPLRASRRPKAAAGRARCDEGSYGHRQQGKVSPSPKKTCLHVEEAQGRHAGDHAGFGQLAVEEAEALQFAFAQAEGQAFIVIDGQFLAG